MIEPELNTYLKDINQHLDEMKAKKGPGIWRSFFNGVFSALGYVVGLALVVVVLSWILARMGLLQAFEQQVGNFTSLVDSAKKLIPDDQPNTNSKQGSSTGGTLVTLPDGRQIKVLLPQQ